MAVYNGGEFNYFDDVGWGHGGGHHGHHGGHR